MIKAHVQYSLDDIVYRNLLFACSKRGYKVKTLVKGFGIITASKKSLFKRNTDLIIKVTSKDEQSTNIEVAVTRKNITDSSEEQKMVDTIYKYF